MTVDMMPGWAMLLCGVVTLGLLALMVLLMASLLKYIRKE